MPRRPLLVLLPMLGVLACQDPLAPDLRVVPPPCAEPAPLLGNADPRAPGYIVVFADSVDARQETDRLAAAYGFQATHVYEFALRGFSARLTPEAVASVRCEPTVDSVEHDGVMSID